MAEVETLHEALIDELKDLYNAERQLTKALPKLAKHATNRQLKAALNGHLRETRTQVRRLEQAMRLLEEKPEGKLCDGMQGIIKEGNKMLEEVADGPVMDAAIIAGAQRAEHYEIGAYGTCIAWAKSMGHRNVVRLLTQTLNDRPVRHQRSGDVRHAGRRVGASDVQSEEDRRLRRQVTAIIERSREAASGSVGCS
jgi:ferritin-like metal-binding protein YciE